MLHIKASKRRLLAVAFLSAFFLFACDSDSSGDSFRSGLIDWLESSQTSALAAPQSPSVVPATAPLAHVGQLSITDSAVIYRIGTGRAYGNELSPATALVALVNDAIEAEVGSMAGLSLSAQEMQAFATGVKKNSKAPAVLKAIRAVFGTDAEAYQQQFLAPKMMNRKLRSWFSRNAAMHGKQRASMQQAWAQVQAGEDFEAVAKATGLHFATQDYGKKKAVTPDAFKAYFPTGMAAMSAGFKKLLAATKPGDIVGTIAENDHSYRIVRVLSIQGDIYQTEEISLAKASFDDWYQKQAKSLRIEIVDAELKEAIQARYSNIAWVKRLLN